MPFGANSVTATNDKPSSTVHQSTHWMRQLPSTISGACPPVNHVDKSDTKAAPMTAP